MTVEHFDHTMECPECGETVRTVPAEGVPDQTLRACPKCDAVFWQEIGPRYPWTLGSGL